MPRSPLIALQFPWSDCMLPGGLFPPFDRRTWLPVIGPNNGPTYYHPLEKPATATRQLDYVFASKSMLNSVSTRALNSAEEWGPSDH